MFSPRLKTGYFVLEGSNSFATTYFFYYLYFYLQTAHGFGNRANLAVAALDGIICAVAAYFGGKYAEKFGYFSALKLGFGGMCASVGLGSVLSAHVGWLIAAQGCAVMAMSFTWATLEALVSGGEDRKGLQWMVGLYNVVWAATAAIAYFTGGWMLEKLGLRSFFYVPMSLFAVQFALTLWLERQAARGAGLPGPAAAANESTETESAGTVAEHPHLSANPKSFRQMAWFANPLAYVALNTTVAVMPGVAANLGLSTMQAGFCGSVWTFARVGAFCLLWFWPGWHYRFRYLLGAYLLLAGSFALMLTVPNLAVLVVAQLFFGGALGLIYYSSLFYAMDLSDSKGEHGGIHEAVIGLGNFGGPAVGAASLWLWPQYPNSGALAVSGVLLAGVSVLVGIWSRGRRQLK